MAFIQDLLVHHNVAIIFNKIRLSVGSAIKFMKLLQHRLLMKPLLMRSDGIQHLKP